MQSAIHDPQIVSTYHDEYLRLINYYMNTKRPSAFVRYFNIDIDQSIYDDKLDATYDLYHVSKLMFNTYDFTPTYYLAPIVNAAANVPDLRGQMMDATSSIVTYSINSPRIHDLVMFYEPVSSGEIFRVSGLRTAVNAVHSSPNVRWFELELEYAPIRTTQELKILKHYVYNMAEESYVTYDEYISFIKKFDQCESILDKLADFYDPYYDLYQYNQLAPIETNEVIIFFKKMYTSKYRRIFEKYKFPYGYLDKMNFTQVYPSIEAMCFVPGNYTYHVYNLLTNKVEDYTWSVTHKEAQNKIDEMLLYAYQLTQAAF